MRPMFEHIKRNEGVKSGNVGVEIGVFDGNNAFDILDNLSPGTLHLVDDGAWGADKTLEKRLSEYKGSNYKYYKQRSTDAVHLFKNDELDFVYIDADHDYESVKNDIEAWWPKVKDGGVFGGHDYWNDTCLGVRLAVNEFIRKYNLELRIKDLDWWVIK